MNAPKKKVVKSITVDVSKCNGCRACELICSSFHAQPRFSSVNPARSRIRVTRNPLEDIYLPVYGGEYTEAECAGRDKYILDGREYEECAFCRAVCPSRDFFKEPDSGLPLKCDMCESDPTLDEPWCVKWCLADALIYEERVEEAPPAEGIEELDRGLEAIADKHGWPSVLDAVRRMADKGGSK